MVGQYDAKRKELPAEDSGVPQVPYENIVPVDMADVSRRLDISLGTGCKCGGCGNKCALKELGGYKGTTHINQMK